MKNWQEMLGVDSFELKRFLSSESEQLVWKSEGLPSDTLSMENAMVILQVGATSNNRIVLEYHNKHTEREVGISAVESRKDLTASRFNKQLDPFESEFPIYSQFIVLECIVCKYLI
jgi:hypothetical protein